MAAGRTWGTGVLLSALLAAPAVGQVREVSLTEAIRMAERAQPGVIQALGQVRSAGARVLTAKGAFLPNLNLNASGSSFWSENSRIDPATGQIVVGGSGSKSLTTSLSGSVELFAGFRRSSELRAANATEAAATADLVDARFAQALLTTNTFFDALAARQLLRVREAGVRRAEQQLATSVARFQAGAATRSDSLRSLVGLGNAQLQLVNTEAQLATAEANLGRLIGETERVQAVDDSSFYQTLQALDVPALRAEALAQAPAVQAAEAGTRASEASLKASRAGYWPSLSLSGNASLNGTNRNAYTMLSQNQLSLAFTWPLFNRFSREQQVTNQSIALDNARAAEAEARRAVIANLTARLAELEAARLTIEITQRSVEAATEDLRVQQERYRLGVSTILDLLTTQEALSQAEVDAVTARFDYLRARAAIEALIGRPL